MNCAISNRVLRTAVFVCGLLIAGCSGGDEQAGTPADVIDLREPDGDTEGEVDGSADADADGDDGDDDVLAVGGGTIDESIEIIDEPSRRLAENQTIDASNWIARTFMDETTVELVWSPVEGADSYRLFRLRTADADYDAIATGQIDGAQEIYEGPDFGFIDTDPPTGTFLTYLIVADVSGETTEPRWTEALTVDDVTPPAPITGLVATNSSDGVLLQWEPSPDDVEFAAYNVSLLVDGQLFYIGGGADVGLVSFLDDEAFAGTRTYVVSAADFHNNVSESAQVDVTR